MRNLPPTDEVIFVSLKWKHAEIESESDSDYDSEFNEFDHYLQWKMGKKL
jgi:hypothetical protein